LISSQKGVEFEEPFLKAHADADVYFLPPNTRNKNAEGLEAFWTGVQRRAT